MKLTPEDAVNGFLAIGCVLIVIAAAGVIGSILFAIVAAFWRLAWWILS